jgi:hypothetical protein
MFCAATEHGPREVVQHPLGPRILQYLQKSGPYSPR